MGFLTSSKKVRSDLNHLETYISELDRNMKIKQNSILSKNEEENLDMRINAIVTTFTDLSDDIKIRLQETRKETEKITKKIENRHLIDLRESHTLGQSKKLSELMKRFQDVQYNCKKREKEKMKENFLIACPDATEEQLNDLDDPEKAAATLEAAFALGSKSSQGILLEAKSRKMKIDQIVENMNKIIALIEEIDKLVNSNTSVTDELVIKMDESLANTDGVITELTSARVYQERANWYARFFTIIGFIVFFLIALTIYRAIFR